MNKPELRKSYLTKRQLLSVAEREAASAHIAASLFDNIDFAKVNVLHCFIPIERFGEVDTRPIFQRVWSEFPNTQTVVPRINHQIEELESLKYGPEVELIHNRWQIDEPAHNDIVDPAEIELVLVPLLCFDRRGNRVGYGKGYYDRFLRRCRADCQKIGLSMFPPVDEISDAHEGDVKLDYCITPKDIFTFVR